MPAQQRRPGSAAPCLVVRRNFTPPWAGNRAAGTGRDHFGRMPPSPDTVRSRRVRARLGPAGSPRPAARRTARHRACGLWAPETSATAPRPRPETSPGGSSDAGTPAGRPAHAWPRCRRSRSQSHPPQPPHALAWSARSRSGPRLRALRHAAPRPARSRRSTWGGGTPVRGYTATPAFPDPSQNRRSPHPALAVKGLVPPRALAPNPWHEHVRTRPAKRARPTVHGPAAACGAGAGGGHRAGQLGRACE